MLNKHADMSQDFYVRSLRSKTADLVLVKPDEASGWAGDWWTCLLGDLLWLSDHTSKQDGGEDHLLELWHTSFSRLTY